MHRSLVTLTLAGTLALATMSEAGPRPRQAPPSPAAGLTYPELLCEAAGKFTYARTLDRDSGWALFDALRRVRAWDEAHDTPAPVRRYHDTLLQWIWTLAMIREFSTHRH
jgi:hypothetical protein